MHRVCHRPVSLHFPSAPLKYHPRGYYCDFQSECRRRWVGPKDAPQDNDPSQQHSHICSRSAWYCTEGVGKRERYRAEYFSLVNRYPILLRSISSRECLSPDYIFISSPVAFLFHSELVECFFYPIQWMGFPERVAGWKNGCCDRALFDLLVFDFFISFLQIPSRHLFEA
jgi:hypothetical protein